MPWKHSFIFNFDIPVLWPKVIDGNLEMVALFQIKFSRFMRNMGAKVVTDSFPISVFPLCIEPLENHILALLPWTGNK